MEKEENLNQENTSIEPSDENNKTEDQNEKVEKNSSVEEKIEITPEEKINVKNKEKTTMGRIWDHRLHILSQYSTDQTIF